MQEIMDRPQVTETYSYQQLAIAIINQAKDDAKIDLGHYRKKLEKIKQKKRHGRNYMNLKNYALGNFKKFSKLKRTAIDFIMYGEMEYMLTNFDNEIDIYKFKYLMIEEIKPYIYLK